jgi:hypothetical protein
MSQTRATAAARLLRLKRLTVAKLVGTVFVLGAPAFARPALGP